MTEQQQKQTRQALLEAGLPDEYVHIALSAISSERRAGYADGYSAASAGFDITLANIAERLSPDMESQAIKMLRYDLRHRNFP